MNHKVKIGEETYEVNLEAAIKQGLIKKVSPPPKVGQVFRLGSGFYTLNLITKNSVCFICLFECNRFTDALRVIDPWDITSKEWDKITAGNNFEYVGEASNLREILNKFNSDTPCPASSNDPDDES